jgi:hypothetical protein
MEDEWCRISHHVHRIEFLQIVRDAEIAYAISPVVRRHRLSAEETEKFLVELRIPRAANVARIMHGLVVNCSQKASSKLTAQELIGRIAPFGQRIPVNRVCSLNSIYESRTVLNFTAQQKWTKP